MEINWCEESPGDVFEDSIVSPRRTVSERMTFFGHRVTNFVLEHTPHFEVVRSYPSMSGVVRTTAPDDIKARVSFACRSNDSLFAELRTQWFCNREFTISRLGDMRVCEGCRAMMRPGELLCHRCGAPYVVTVKDSRYERMGRAFLEELSWDAPSDLYLLDKVIVNLTLDLADIKLPRGVMARGGHKFEIDDLSTGGVRYTGNGLYDLFSGWCTTHLQDGWICKFCHTVNDEDCTECHACGGGRRPFSDLLKIADGCLYCGNPTDRGVCSTCGHTADSYSVWPPRYDW